MPSHVFLFFLNDMFLGLMCVLYVICFWVTYFYSTMGHIFSACYFYFSFEIEGKFF
jgi:hypothetical protein